MLHLIPISFGQAREFVVAHHRHHAPPQGMKFTLGAANDTGRLVGVVIVGRPVARAHDDGRTLEVTRTCTDGMPNANSMLYAAAWRVTRGLGYTRLITYTQHGETGASLRGAGWKVIGQRRPRPGWNTPARPRRDTHPTHVGRTVWEAS